MVRGTTVGVRLQLFDFRLAGDLMPVVQLHDILTHPAWPSIEVGRLWEEIKVDHLTFEIVADRNAEWGGIGVVLL